MTAAVQERLTLTVDEAKLYLRVDHDDEDALLEELITSAKAAADQFLNNPFTAPDGSPGPIPEVIKTWVMRRVSMLYEHRQEGLRGDMVQGLGSSDYGRALSDTGGSVDYSLIQMFRLNPGL